MSVVELAPIVKSLELRCPAAAAFRMFTDEVSAWWPMATHSRAKAAAGEKTVRVTIEPRIGGRVFETLNTGEERDWGEVLVYEPGQRFSMLWQLGRTRAQAGEVDVRFESLGPARSRVTLTHSHWERLGEEAARTRGEYANGWIYVFDECFGQYARKA